MVVADNALWWAGKNLANSHRTPLCLNGMSYAGPFWLGSQIRDNPNANVEDIAAR
jgi:hypothetical protein